MHIPKLVTNPMQEVNPLARKAMLTYGEVIKDSEESNVVSW